MSYVQPWMPQQRRMIVNQAELTCRYAAEGYPHDDIVVAKEHLRWDVTLRAVERQLAEMTRERDELRRHLKAVREVSDAVAAMP